MLPMMTSGKLFEPQILTADKDMDSIINPPSDHEPHNEVSSKNPASNEKYVSGKRLSTTEKVKDEMQVAVDDTTLNESHLKTMDIGELTSKNNNLLNKNGEAYDISNKVK